MLLPFGDETLIARAWRIANESCQELFEWVSVVAIPKADESGPLGDELRRIGATVFAWDGPEWDVLGRFYRCAHTYRWHPDTIIVRYTPDDPFKTPGALRAAARGFRLPVEQGGEAFTLAMLTAAQERCNLMGERGPIETQAWVKVWREHITDALFPFRLPPMQGEGFTIDVQADYEAALKRLEKP